MREKTSDADTHRASWDYVLYGIVGNYLDDINKLSPKERESVLQYRTFFQRRKELHMCSFATLSLRSLRAAVTQLSVTAETKIIPLKQTRMLNYVRMIKTNQANAGTVNKMLSYYDMCEMKESMRDEVLPLTLLAYYEQTNNWECDNVQQAMFEWCANYEEMFKIYARDFSHLSATSWPRFMLWTRES